MAIKELEVALENANVKAFLTMIRAAEGTNYPNGYRYMFGSRHDKERLFNDFKDHPRVYTPYKNKLGEDIRTSAAGAYQLIVKTWDVLQRRLKLTDFSPRSQDLCALELIREQGALGMIINGRTNEAIKLCNKIWASLYGSNVGQPERSLAQLDKYYQAAGGKFTA